MTNTSAWPTGRDYPPDRLSLLRFVLVFGLVSGLGDFVYDSARSTVGAGMVGCCVARLLARFFKPLRQVIESINNTFKGQLDLEQHGGHTVAGVIVRIWQRAFALTAAMAQRQDRRPRSNDP